MPDSWNPAQCLAYGSCLMYDVESIHLPILSTKFNWYLYVPDSALDSYSFVKMIKSDGTAAFVELTAYQGNQHQRNNDYDNYFTVVDVPTTVKEKGREKE